MNIPILLVLIWVTVCLVSSIFFYNKIKEELKGLFDKLDFGKHKRSKRRKRRVSYNNDFLLDYLFRLIRKLFPIVIPLIMVLYVGNIVFDEIGESINVTVGETNITTTTVNSLFSDNKMLILPIILSAFILPILWRFRI